MQGEYEKQISVLIEENKKLQEEIKVLESTMTEFKVAKNILQQRLYSSHMEICRMLKDSEKKFEDMIQYKKSILTAQQDKNAQIKASINKLMDQIQFIIHE